jgi:hypothetical protein
LSAETKGTLEAALIDHIRDEGYLDEDELVTEYLIIAASVPVSGDDVEEAAYIITHSEGSTPHSRRGLAFWFLFRRKGA